MGSGAQVFVRRICWQLGKETLINFARVRLCDVVRVFVFTRICTNGHKMHQYRSAIPLYNPNRTQTPGQASRLQPAPSSNHTQITEGMVRMMVRIWCGLGPGDPNL